MSERSTEIETFLSNAEWSKAKRQPLAGDLSTRRYTRLIKGLDTAILMDAAHTMAPFRTITNWLRNVGFSAPQIIADGAENGLLLLEDFGDISISSYLAATGDHRKIDALCIDLLLALRAETPPNLTAPDAEALVGWTTLADEHYPGTNSQELVAFRERLSEALQNALTDPASISLRDFHADNLMWLPDRSGIKRLGLLDYQDALATHPVYDLASYLTDARVDITPQRRNAVLAAYLRRSNDDETAFRSAFAAFSAQRNLRILGIFARGAGQGKDHHLTKLPRVHRYFSDALDHDLFRDLKDQTLAALPDPTTAMKALT